jgi:hypothetical protein
VSIEDQHVTPPTTKTQRSQIGTHIYIYISFVFVVLQFLEPCQDTFEQNMVRDMARTELEEEDELKARAVADEKK